MKSCISFVAYSLLIVSLVGGCSSTKPAKTAVEMTVEPVEQLTLGPGDVVDVKFFNTPELDESQIVRSDGCITLQLIGDVDVRSLTPTALQQDLVTLFSPHLKHPRITVLVRRMNDYRIYVGGEVKRPGPVQMTRRMTVMEAIMEVGGTTRPTADLCNVLVVRQRDGRHYGCLINISDVLSGRERAQFLLQPRDIVYVPATAITKVDDWVDQYINKVVPQTRTIFLYPIGPGNAGTVGIDTSAR